MAGSADALMYREVGNEGTVWDVRRIRAVQIPLYEARGWILLASGEDLRDDALRETYAADLARYHPRR